MWVHARHHSTGKVEAGGPGIQFIQEPAMSLRLTWTTGDDVN